MTSSNLAEGIKTRICLLVKGLLSLANELKHLGSALIFDQIKVTVLRHEPIWKADAPVMVAAFTEKVINSDKPWQVDQNVVNELFGVPGGLKRYICSKRRFISEIFKERLIPVSEDDLPPLYFPGDKRILTS
jgi:hypothetical protein